MRCSILPLSFVAICLLLISGCPGSTPPPDDGGNGNGTVTGSPVSNEERLASLDKVEQAIAPFELNGDPAVSDQIATLLSTMPDFAEVKVYAGSVTARFTDDEVLVVINTRPADLRPELQNKSIVSNRSISDPSPLTQSIFLTPGEGKSTVLPKSKNVLLVNAMGTAYKDDTPELRKWFLDAGYSVAIGDGTIESFRSDVTNIGVLYVSTHGAPLLTSFLPAVNKEVLEGLAETPRPTVPLEGSDGKDHFVIWTTTVIDNDSVNKYRKEVRSGRLAYIIGDNDRSPGGKPTRGRHFGITEAFVYDHWRCQAGALIFMDCCWSANSRIVDVCLSKAVNASGYLGWTAPSLIQYTSSTVRYFFDRTLGANSYSPTATRQRAFSVREVYSFMQTKNRRNLDPDPDLPLANNLDLPLHQSVTEDYAANLTGVDYSELTLFFRTPVEDQVLRPGILNVKAGSTLLTLHGNFGEDPGSVTVGGTPCTVRPDGWTTNQILCDLPDGSSGPVVVEAGERLSNPRALTLWNMTFHRTFMDYPTQELTDCPSCFYEATVHYTFRADAGPTRLNLDDDVAPSNYIGAADKGDIEVTNAGGTFPIGQGSSITLAPNPDDGAAFIGTCLGFLPTFDNNYLGACFFLKGSENVIAFSPTISAEGLFRNYHGGTYDGIVDPHQVLYYGNIIGNELNLPLSPNFNIAAGNQTTGPNSFFEWDAADAQSPPGPNDPR